MSIHLLKESILFAIGALTSNRLRSFLSLLGVTVGIFAIISVLTLVDSLENNDRKSVASLGENVVFVQKWPWSFGDDYPWWKYINRPVPNIADLEEIEKRSELSYASAFNISIRKTVYQGNNSIDQVDLMGVTHHYNLIKNFNLSDGRYFTENESKSGKNVGIIGALIGANLFPGIDPIGKEIKIMGKVVQVIGVFEYEGENIFGNNVDGQVLIPLNYMKDFTDIRNDKLDPFIFVKARYGVSNTRLKDELRGIMRSVRKLKPSSEDDFALNEISLLSKGFDELFSVIGLAGWVIGGFSILVGGFGIANIMFVSVKERTSIIGIQKSLGAKNNFILFQFLIEAIILCLIGGTAGLLLIYSGTLIMNTIADLGIELTFKNILTGIGISGSIGIISGFLPAYTASRLDPVEAIRSV